MPNDQELHVDVAVIGAGTAGLAAYRAAAAHTDRVVIIEAAAYGTTCARVGCMPSKLLIAAADAAHQARDAGPFGVHCDVRVDGVEVMERVRRERDRFVGFVVESVDRIPDDRKVRGRARFVDRNVLDVGGTRIHARATVIATGSSPFIPPVFDSVRDRLLVNDDVFAWTELPESVVVFGTGVIGLELGQALHRLGVRVRVFGIRGVIGPLSDPEVRASAEAALLQELAMDARSNVHAVRPDGKGVAVEFTDTDGNRKVESFASILVAAGRRPNVTGLGLEHTGIPLDDKGAPLADRFTMQAGDTSVFFAGDVSDDIPLLHEAADEGHIAGDNAARYPNVRPGPRRTRLAIAFTDPQLAIVGSSYEEAQRTSDVVVGSVDFGDQGRSRVMRQNRGLGRVYADASTGRFLGAELAGPRVEHLAHLLAWAHQQELTVPRMLTMPFYHPVVEEGLRTALRAANAKIKARTTTPDPRT